MVIETATGAPTQDITDRLELALAAEDEARIPGDKTPVDEVIKDDDLPLVDDTLPDDDDPDDDDDEDQDDLAAIAEDDEDLSLAGYLGIDDERISVDEETGEVSFVSKVDGEDALVPLKDLVSSYQLQGHVNNKSVALENDVKEFEQVKTDVTQELEMKIKGSVALSKALEDELVHEYNSIDWEALRVSDPGNWTALRQEYSEKAQRIQQAQQLAGEQLLQIGDKQKEEAMVVFKKHIIHNKSEVIKANPDWADESKFKDGINKLNTFLKSTYEFTDDELKALNDHRLLKVIQDAQSFRQGKKAAEGKRVKKLPKFRKPGQSRGNAVSLRKARAVKANKKRLKDGGGSIKDVAATILDRM